MAAKYYFTSLARRPMTLSGHVFKFLVCSAAGGSAAGVLEATDPVAIQVLDDAVRAKRGVKEISAEEFEELKKKGSVTPQRVNSNGYQPRVIQPPILPQLAVEERAGVPSAGKPSAAQQGDIFSGPGGKPMSEAEKNRPSIGNLLRVGKVNPPKPFAASEGKTRKAAARADRAKIRVVRPAE
jgi:hypothetical protein